jgi:hypothetical protein
MRYLVVVEPGRVGWGAHVPDVPGCVAAADSRDEVIELIHDALTRHQRASGEGSWPAGVRRRRSCRRPPTGPGRGAVRCGHRRNAS